jgi:hypothetical protein
MKDVSMYKLVVFTESVIILYVCFICCLNSIGRFLYSQKWIWKNSGLGCILPLMLWGAFASLVPEKKKMNMKKFQTFMSSRLWEVWNSVVFVFYFFKSMNIFAGCHLWLGCRRIAFSKSIVLYLAKRFDFYRSWKWSIFFTFKLSGRCFSFICEGRAILLWNITDFLLSSCNLTLL